MRLKNDALQELYDTIIWSTITVSCFEESPIDRAFKECDEKLSESATFAHIKKLEDRCENLERSNKALRDDNDKLGDKIIELKKKNEQLEKDIDICKCSNEMLLASSMESISEKRKLENEIDAKSKENADLSDRLAKLQRNFDRLWTDQIQENRELRSKIADLQETKPKLVDYEALRKELDNAKEDRDAWRRRATYAEKDRDLTKRNKDGWRSRAMHAEKRCATLQKENTDLSKKVVDFEKRITELQKKGDDLTKKGEDLRKNSMHELWRKLQEVSDATLSERLGYFQDVCDIDDLVEWDLEDFLNEYNEWQKKKEKKERDCDRCKMNTVLGVKPKEEEHKLDYGDAVRVPWKSYDYMYIGPEGKHIRLFDPKTHTVVVVSVTDNLTYQGYKIILCDEDDIRKIWKDKK